MPELTILDISTDSKRPATQEDIDFMQNVLFKISMRPTPEVIGSSPDFTFKLAIYPNPMRSDGVFVSEEKEIEPYAEIRGLQGQLLFPAVPSTPYAIRGQLPFEFAYELVRRWNSAKGYAK